MNLRAQNLKAAVLRHLGRKQEALQVLASASRAFGPLDVRTMAETFLANDEKEAGNRLASTMNEFPATAQETAAEYLNEGLWQDGSDVLKLAVAAAPDKSRINPMTYYYLGYFTGKLGDEKGAARYDQLAMQMPPDYVFPFQNKEIAVLRQAIATNPNDARAPYYLGNLLYDWQPEEAARMWQASVALDPSFAITHRNLAVAYMHQKSGADIGKAIAEMEKAVSCEHKYAMHFTELDELYEKAGTPLEKRLALLRQNEQVVARRDDAVNREIALQIDTGQINNAIQTMTTRRFRSLKEKLQRSRSLDRGPYAARARRDPSSALHRCALTSLQAASTVPANLPIGIGFDMANPYATELDYWRGVAYAGSGHTQQARESWQHAAAQPDSPLDRRANRPGNITPRSDQVYYRGLSLQKLGDEEKAGNLFRGLVQSGQTALQNQAPTASETAKGQDPPRIHDAIAHYIAGLRYLGLQNPAAAKTELREAAELSPDLLGARTVLASLQ